MLTKSNFLDFKTCLDEFWLHRQFPDALKEQNSIAQRNALGASFPGRALKGHNKLREVRCFARSGLLRMVASRGAAPGFRMLTFQVEELCLTQR